METIIIDHVFSLFKIALLTLLILFSFKGLVKNKPFTSLLIGVSSFAFLIATLISFNLKYGKYVVFIFYVAVLIVFIYKNFKKQSSFLKFLKENRSFVFVLLITSTVSLFYLIFNLNITFLYNGHDPYFYGIPYEIIEGNYSSRIKIWDNYPVTWSKYHFFPGALASLFLFSAGLKNIFIYKFYKFLLIGIMFFAFEENLKSNLKLQFYKTLIFSFPITLWLINTNGALPLLFLILSISLYLNKKIDYSILFLLFFASSLSRHVFPGTIICLILLCYNNKLFIKSRITLLLAFPIINIISMIFTGYNKIPFELSYYTNGEFIYNFLYGRGGSFLFQNLLYNIYDVTVINQPSLHSIVYFLPLLFLFLLVKKYKTSLISLLAVVILFTSIIIQLLLKFHLNSDSEFIDFSFYLKGVYLINALIAFCYPFYIFQKFYSKKKEFYVLSLFFALSIINLIIIPTSGPSIHYFFVDIIVVFILSKEIHLNPLILKKQVLLYSFMLISIIPLNSSQHYFEPPTEYLNTHEIEKKPLNYSSNKNRADIILESNIYGRRIYYNESSDEAYHQSNQFLSKE